VRADWTASQIAALLAMAGVSQSAIADPVSDFYRGKTVTIYAGTSVGGGYDTYARALARFIGRHIPGQPAVVAGNMPGGTGLKLANWLATVAPKDGTVLALLGRGIPSHRLLGGSGAVFDPTKLNWIGSMNDESSVCVMSARSGVTRFEDLMTRDVFVGSQGGVADSHVYATFLKNLFKARIKIVAGYPGTAETVIAMERGEIDGMCGWAWTSLKLQRPDWVKQRSVNIVLQLALSRNPDLPDVPMVGDLAKGPQQQSQVRLVFSRQTTGRPVAAADGVPAERIAALRRAFDDTLRDQGFRQLAETAKIDINPVSGTMVQELVGSMLATPRDTVDETIRNMTE
jgi:tripartite-type tricarboxylate transporter receptor subunit TctC